MKLVNWRTSQISCGTNGPIVVHPTLILAGDWSSPDSTFGGCVRAARTAAKIVLQGIDKTAGRTREKRTGRKTNRRSRIQNSYVVNTRK